MENEIHLQGIGKVKAIPAGELKVGDKVVYNYGYTYEVLDIIPMSPQFLRVAIRATGNLKPDQDPGNIYFKRIGRNTLVGIREQNTVGTKK